jgi:hypothetical protein
MKGAYKAALADPELHSLKSTLALLDSRLVDLLDQLSSTEAPPWGKAVEALNDFRLAKSDLAKEKALINLESIIRTGADGARAHEQIWKDVMVIIEQRTRSTSAEHKRLTDLQANVPVEHVLMYGTALNEAVREVVLNVSIPRETMLVEIERRMRPLLPVPKQVEVEVVEE